MSKSGTGGRDWFFVGLATLSFIADTYTLYQIVSKGVVFDFWTWRWIIGIILVAILAVGGFAFLGISNSGDAVKNVLFVFGVAYLLCSLIVYLYWGFRAAESHITVGDFFGFLALFSILAAVGIFGIAVEKDRDALRFPSYGYATASLAYVVLLVHVYIGRGTPFTLWSFAGQATILLIGVLLFGSLYLNSIPATATKTTPAVARGAGRRPGSAYR